MVKHKTLILCGEWNINFLQPSPHTRELNNLLLQYNLKHIANVPTRITKTTATLMDVVITNERKSINSLKVIDLGLSDHYAQILSIPISDSSNIPYRIKKRQFSEANVHEFLYLLNQVTWQEVYVQLDVNAKFSTFMDIFLHCYNGAFPIKTLHVRDTIKNNWITQGIKISSKKMQLLDNQKKTTVMKKKDLEYIENCRKIYRRVIQEAKRTVNNNYISSAKNKLKAAWQVINKEIGKSSTNNKNVELRWGKNKISNPRAPAELFNSYFAETVQKLADQNRGTHATYNMADLKINTCPQTIFINPVTDSEVEKVVKNLKGKCSSGFDDVKDSTVKKCVQFIKTPLANICNASFTSGIFPEILKIAIAKPLHKKRNTGEVQIYRAISLLSVFSKIVEKLMYNRLMSFITKNNILNDAQHGFREGKSTETAAHAFFENIHKAIEKR
jgi:hypothetical protein